MKNLELEWQMTALIDEWLRHSLENQLEDDALPSVRSRELSKFLVSTLLQICAAPFANDCYQSFKQEVLPVIQGAGIELTSEQSEQLFKKSYELVHDVVLSDDSWRIVDDADH